MPSVILLQSLALCVITSISWYVWRRIGVKHPLDALPGPPSQNLWSGNLPQIFNPNGWEFHKMLAETYGPVSKFHGIFGDKILYVFDPKAMYHIIVKDQYVFEETSMFLETNKLIFGNGLLSTLGDHHRKQRKLLNPVFSTNHMREMVPIFHEITHMLRDKIAAKVQDGPQEIDMLDWFSRTALELIGQSGLGYSFDALTEGSKNVYSQAVKNLVAGIFRLTVVRQFLPWAVKIGPPSFREFIVKHQPWKTLREFKQNVDIMTETSSSVFEAKKIAIQKGDEAVLQQVGQGKDIMSILLKANMGASEDDRLSDSELLGQMSTFIFAAMDTTSGALSRTLLTLAEHPKAQARLREEIIKARADKGELGFDDLMNLPYLDAICRETLRLYPPVGGVSRTTRKDVILPFSAPVRGADGKAIHEILIPNNTNVLVSILSSNRNPELWGEDALEWKPERWLSPLPQKLMEAQIPGVYSHMMTFLGGGRSCIGFKFSQLEMKVVLSSMVETFQFTPTKEIVWTMGLSAPRVKDSKDPKFKLPVMVQLHKSS
ncbi:hypothetical protein SERLA73DRAFT_84927 [Serpula lacrymans var. lacrymans S7.3]|uniref:Cytochrome P450 n=2 Tax=Serpula lacrymans var. lacrymans TaxID=341189 RepID=F8PN24_SERL3|nr:uncharacterized protein SERLADRAFT_446100 [Serpula lacrymans var. lacrymans S7.9]EGO03006.1 hypothetical protein SERLA73DRAFT_84927 [Serpula lacrymans var. lacrymans S7.3]EGO28685.1 hypothetical protein SERLADRAFT_446100 [Serpula lacrymans var. lacrymans S7.9]